MTSQARLTRAASEGPRPAGPLQRIEPSFVVREARVGLGQPHLDGPA